MLERAKKYRELGYCPIALRENGKQPVGSWAEFQKRMPTDGELVSKFGVLARHNIGIVCGAISGGLYVRDFDDLEKAREFYRMHKAIIRTMVRTRKGVHFYFRADARNSQGDKEDGRGEGGQVVAPGSVVDGHPYEFITPLVRPEELCVLPVDIITSTKGSTVGTLKTNITPKNDRLEVITNAMSYAEKTPVAVAGQRGHDATFRFACKMVRQPPHGFGLSLPEAWPIAFMWNQRCLPPWSEKDLRRKLTEALKKG